MRSASIRAKTAFLFIFQFVAAENAAAELLAFYEISAEVNGSSSVIRTSKPIEFGTPVTHEFGEYQIHMVFAPAEEKQFTVATSLNAIRPTNNEVVYTLVSDVFEGKISTQQEFGQSSLTIEEEPVSISIVLRLSEI